MSTAVSLSPTLSLSLCCCSNGPPLAFRALLFPPPAPSTRNHRRFAVAVVRWLCLCRCCCRSQSVCVLLFDAPVLVSVVKCSLHFAVVFFGNTRRGWDSSISSNSTKNTTTTTNNPTQSNNYKIFYACSCWCRSVSLCARVCVRVLLFFFNKSSVAGRRGR